MLYVMPIRKTTVLKIIVLLKNLRIKNLNFKIFPRLYSNFKMNLFRLQVCKLQLPKVPKVRKITKDLKRMKMKYLYMQYKWQI